MLQQELQSKPATQKERRLMVARDVLNQLEDKVFIPKSGTWLDICPVTTTGIAVILSMGPKLSLRQFNPIAKKHKKEVNCYGCAVGACLLSYAQLYEDVTVSIPGNSHPMLNTPEAFTYMQKELGDGQMALVEIAYERRGVGCGPSWTMSTTLEERVAAFVFGSRFDTMHERLIAIMKNIIAHDGDFRPDDLTDKEKEG